MVEAGLNLVAAMQSGTLPTRPTAGGSGGKENRTWGVTPWPHGDVPPQLD